MNSAALDTPLPVHQSLRAKGWFATLALLAYLLGSALYIAGERGRIYDNIQALAIGLGRQRRQPVGIHVA